MTPFTFGAPPHGGFVFGTDHVAAIPAGEVNIGEVITFPNTQSGADPMTNTPTPLNQTQHNEIEIQLLPPLAKNVTSTNCFCRELRVLKKVYRTHATELAAVRYGLTSDPAPTYGKNFHISSGVAL